MEASKQVNKTVQSVFSEMAQYVYTQGSELDYKLDLEGFIGPCLMGLINKLILYPLIK